MTIDIEDLSVFPVASAENWRLAAEKALAGARMSKFVATTLDGIEIDPLAPMPVSPRPAMGVRGGGRPWAIVGAVRLADAARTNELILDELNGGASAIELDLRFGGTAAALPGAFAGLYLEMIALHLTGSNDAPALVKAILGEVAGRDKQGGVATVHAGFDPFMALLASRKPKDAGRVSSAIAATTALMAAEKIAGSAATVGGQGWHALGASEAQQIAIALAGGLACRRETPAAGIEFRLVADQNQMLTIAKLRAFRQLWALVGEECGWEAAPAFVHAEAAWRMMARRDPWTNIIRSTIATFAAAVGGADAISTLPHTALIGEPESAARRLARNVQTVLLEESSLDKVADPAAGAAGIEALTDQLAERAWDEFRRIEGEGGLVESVSSGGLPGRIAEVGKTRRLAIARRRLPVTGVSNYPMLAETTPAVDKGPAEPAPLAGVQRDGEAFELLRDRSDHCLAVTGRRPLIYLANLGPVAAFTTRANFAKNLFEAGGIETKSGEGGEDPAAIAAGFAASGARLACLCSDDATYDRLALDMAAALKAAGAQSVCLAGRARDNEEALRAAGIDVFVYDGLDMLALLATLHDQLGIPALSEATP